MVEAAPRRQKLRLVADVPFADAQRRIALRFEQTGDGVFVGAQADRTGRKDHLRQRHALGIAAGEELRATVCKQERRRTT